MVTTRLIAKQSRQQIRGRNAVAPSVVLLFPVPNSDMGLVAALRAGHPDARRALCERHSEELLRIATRILGPDASIGSVVVETLRHSLVRLRELDDPRSFRSWLLSLLVAAARRRLRARRRWTWLSGEHPRNWFDIVRCSEPLVAAYCVLDRLPIEQRLAFCLVVIHSLGISEAAFVLGVSSLTLKRTLVAAHARFARITHSSFPRLMLRQSSHASLGAKIAIEQDELLGDAQICEIDLLQGREFVDFRGRFRCKHETWTLASVVLLVVLACVAAITVARSRQVGFEVPGGFVQSTDAASISRGTTFRSGACRRLS